MYAVLSCLCCPIVHPSTFEPTEPSVVLRQPLYGTTNAVDIVARNRLLIMSMWPPL